MRLYSGMVPEFVRESQRNQIAESLKAAFFAYYRYHPSPGEVSSWRNSLRAIADVFQIGQLRDQAVILEYQLPLSSKRLDCMICGRAPSGESTATIIELKQWEKCAAAEPQNVVSSWIGGASRLVLHPSVQVGQYRQYLEDTHSAFHDGPDSIKLAACSYLHNYRIAADDPLLAPKFKDVVVNQPLFDLDGADALAQFLNARVAAGKGRAVIDRIERSAHRPSKKLMDHVSTTIKTRAPWILLDEQLVVFEHIQAVARFGLDSHQKKVVLVHGGPGTGKSVLAINLVAELLRDGISAHYATGSKAFTETLWDLLGSRSRSTFKYFNNYGRAAPNEIDVLICDESHRIRATSNDRFTRRELRSDKPQIREILDAAKVSVFFIDDRQGVRPNEVGSTRQIRAHALEVGADVSEFKLEIQFRCGGSSGFVNWIDNTLGIEKTANVMWEGAEGFEFKIVGSPAELEAKVREKASEGATARVAAGFCWPWSMPRDDGTLVDDIVIDDYRRPWDAKPGAKKLAAGIPPAALWATDPNGIGQIGCVYNVQGFELDYIGVIWGKDLTYDLDNAVWIGNRKESADAIVKRSKDNFATLVKNTYRVLLSRGIKGCFICFLDKDTERFVRSRVEAGYEDTPRELARVAEPIEPDEKA